MTVFTDVPQPPAHKLTISDVYGAGEKPDIDLLKNHFCMEGRLEEECALKIIEQCTAILSEEKTMLEIEAPLTGEIID